MRMSTRSFHLRLKATYKDEKNTLDELKVEVLNDNQWESAELDIRSPGFFIYINGLFSCQHLYMRTNAAERGLMLTSAEGNMQINANQQWQIQDIKVSFQANLKSGSPSEADLSYIRERMHHCPVTSNLKDSAKLYNSVTLIQSSQD